MPHAIPGHSAPAVGFEVPLEMLAACHGRVQHQCDTLQRLLAHLKSHGADRAAQEAAQAVVRYFDTAARHHHEDEEHDLFPALLESTAAADALGLRRLTESLCSEHRLLEQRWAGLRQQLVRVSEGSASSLADDEVQAWVQQYGLHIAREEAELLPLASQLLSALELDRIGLAMRARRGVIEPSPDHRSQRAQPERPAR